MQIPYVRGRVAEQAHVGVPGDLHEEEYAREGFFGRYAHLYRSHAPVGWTRIEGPLKPRAYDTKLAPPSEAARAGDYTSAKVCLLENQDVRISTAALGAPMPYVFRNADADELLFVHAGAGRLESDFGSLAYECGDYLTIPRGTAFRLAPTSASSFLVIETTGELRVPDRGLLGQHALFDPAVLRVPTPGETSTLAASPNGEWELRIARERALTRVFYPYCPLDTVGWKGTLSVTKLNVRDIRPVTSERYHLPPSAHATYVADGVVVCTFAPRPLENGDPLAMKVPFYHSNIDYDEVLFYHSGDFFSRTGISAGMLTFHPQGIHHGPQPGAAERAKSATRTEELAVMIDTRRPLTATPESSSMENGDYWKSWQGKR
ncbi:MAG: homogentisate 1,2-dioxygenase [Polyangiaceae bacterium]